MYAAPERTVVRTCGPRPRGARVRSGGRRPGAHQGRPRVRRSAGVRPV